MHAAVLTATATMDYTTVAVPEPGPGEVLVRVAASGVCGSDLATYRGSHPYKRPPIVLGHELAGVVERSGPGVTRLAPGDRVCSWAFSPCDRCEHCRAGDVHLCPDLRAINHTGWDGSFAEYVLLRENMTFVLPPSVPLSAGALVEPLSVALHAVRRAPAGAERIAILGAGGVGLCCLVAARRLGVRRIACTDLGDGKRALAERLGADAYVDAADGDAGDRLRAALGGPADAAIVAAGQPEAMRDAADAVARGGTIVVVAYFDGAVPVEMNRLVREEKAIVPSALCTAADFAEVIGWLERGEVDVEGLVTHRFPLREAPAVLRMLDGGDVEAGKVLIEVGGA
jgi:threonine dehydrogenase-like Zn-dependent dehydrogenase